MDRELIERMGYSGTAPPAKKDRMIGVENLVSGEIEIEVNGQKQAYSLKPLAQLFGKGTGLETLDPKDTTWMPLLLPIEETIARYWEGHLSLTDAKVLLTLDELSMDPAGPATDPLKQAIQANLRLALSFSDYSRTEVKGAFRKISKSVKRHTSLAGPGGYLKIIHEMFASGRL